MTEYNLIPQVVTIAGSDSGGGWHASRFKTFQARQAFGFKYCHCIDGTKYVWRAR